MFNKHLALLQPEQERIQCYLGTACRTTQEKQQSSATSLDTWMHRKARLSPSTAPRGTRIQLSPVCRPENFACRRKRDFTSNASEQHYSGSKGQAALAGKSPLLYIKLRHLLSFVLNSSSAQVQSKASSKHNKGLLLPSKCHSSIETQD